MTASRQADLISHCISAAFPHRTVSSTELLTGGRINTNVKVNFSSDEPPVVLRLHKKGSASCLKEAAVIELIKSSVPVPEILYVAAEGLDGSEPFSIIEFVEGVTFQQLKQTGDLSAIHQAAASVGETLAAIGSYSFEKPGSLFVDGANELKVGKPFTRTADPIPEILEILLKPDLTQHRLGADLTQRLREFVLAWAPSLPDITDVSRLVHSDFGNRNILVNNVSGRWKVVAVLDWEFAFSGSPLLDVGNFLRYDSVTAPLREPYFSRSFVEHGGELPHNWRNIVRVIDLTALVEVLSHDYLPEDVTAEIIQLIQSTLNECLLVNSE
jgi:aminoglycoside phosphotransferase (APT) family kinase protein